MALSANKAQPKYFIIIDDYYVLHHRNNQLDQVDQVDQVDQLDYMNAEYFHICDNFVVYDDYKIVPNIELRDIKRIWNRNIKSARKI